MVDETVIGPSTPTGEVIETFNETEVMGMIDEFDILGDNVYSSLDSMDSLVAENVQVASGAIAGKVGGILFTEWSENCVPLLNFSRFFDGISESMRKIYNRSTETADAIEAIYNQEDPNALPNMTGSSTPEGGSTISTEETAVDPTTETGATGTEGETGGTETTVSPTTETGVTGAGSETSGTETVETAGSGEEATGGIEQTNTGVTDGGNTTEGTDTGTEVDPASATGVTQTSDDVGVPHMADENKEGVEMA